MNVAVTVLVIIAFFALFGALAAVLPSWGYSLLCAVWCTGWLVVSLFDGNVVGILVNGGLGIYWWRDFWKRRPPGMRKKITDAVGAKARALKAKVVAAMPQAKPVFVPVPA